MRFRHKISTFQIDGNKLGALKKEEKKEKPELDEDDKEPTLCHTQCKPNIRKGNWNIVCLLGLFGVCVRCAPTHSLKLSHCQSRRQSCSFVYFLCLHFC